MLAEVSDSLRGRFSATLPVLALGIDAELSGRRVVILGGSRDLPTNASVDDTGAFVGRSFNSSRRSFLSLLGGAFLLGGRRRSWEMVGASRFPYFNFTMRVGPDVSPRPSGAAIGDFPFNETDRTRDPLAKSSRF
jgi:hypothetical protein